MVFNVISAGKLIGHIDILLSIMSLGKRSTLQNSQKEYLLSPTGRVRNDLALSVQNVLPALQRILHRALKSICKQAKGVKFQLRCKVLLEKFSFENNQVITIDVWFPAETHTLTVLSQVSSVLNKSTQDMLGKFDAFIHQGSGWVVKEVKVFSLNVNEFTLFSGGGCCSSLPLHIRRSHSCILIGNSCDDRYFLKCIVAALCDKGKNVGRWCGEYEKIMRGILELSSDFLTFPTTSKVIKKFEQKWPVSINVYSYSGVIYPNYLSSTLLQPDRQVVNLLLHSGHYFLIRNMSALVTSQCKMNKRKCHICPSCLSYFVRKDRYESHIRLCKKDGTQYVFPKEGEAELGFSSFNSMVNAPFVIYAGLEMMICKEEMVRRGKTRSKHRHIPISVGTLTVCKDRPEFGSVPFLYMGSDCIVMLMEFLNREQHCVRQI